MSLKLALGLVMQDKKLSRHSVGGWFVEALAKKHDIELLSGTTSEVKVGKFKTQAGTFYCATNNCPLNDSGTAVQKLINTLDIKLHEILIVHDDLRLMPGVARLVASSTKTGRFGEQHKGIIDIGNKCGKEFNRLRLGIGHPGIKTLVPEYVSSDPIPEEKRNIEDAIRLSLGCFHLMLEPNLEQAMHYLHSPPAHREMLRNPKLRHF